MALIVLAVLCVRESKALCVVMQETCAAEMQKHSNFKSESAKKAPDAKTPIRSRPHKFEWRNSDPNSNRKTKSAANLVWRRGRASR